jgi:hypothetical protein
MPEMRADQLKENLYALLALGNETASRILADMPPQHLRRIEQAARTDWLPAELGVLLGEVIWRHVGEAGMRTWSRAALRRAMSGGVMGPLVDTAVRLLGLSPASLLKMGPQGWRAAFREAGELVIVESGPGTMVMDLQGLPESMSREPFVVGIAGALEAVFETCHVAGAVALAPPPPGAGARMVATWTPR